MRHNANNFEKLFFFTALNCKFTRTSNAIRCWAIYCYSTLQSYLCLFQVSPMLKCEYCAEIHHLVESISACRRLNNIFIPCSPAFSHCMLYLMPEVSHVHNSCCPLNTWCSSWINMDATTLLIKFATSSWKFPKLKTRVHLEASQ